MVLGLCVALRVVLEGLQGEKKRPQGVYSTNRRTDIRRTEGGGPANPHFYHSLLMECIQQLFMSVIVSVSVGLCHNTHLLEPGGYHQYPISHFLYDEPNSDPYALCPHE